MVRCDYGCDVVRPQVDPRDMRAGLSCRQVCGFKDQDQQVLPIIRPYLYFLQFRVFRKMRQEQPLPCPGKFELHAGIYIFTGFGFIVYRIQHRILVGDRICLLITFAVSRHPRLPEKYGRILPVCFHRREPVPEVRDCRLHDRLRALHRKPAIKVRVTGHPHQLLQRSVGEHPSRFQFRIPLFQEVQFPEHFLLILRPGIFLPSGEGLAQAEKGCVVQLFREAYMVVRQFINVPVDTLCQNDPLCQIHGWLSSFPDPDYYGTIIPYQEMAVKEKQNICTTK